MQVLLTRQDILQNPELLGDWIQQSIDAHLVLKSNGCAFAIEHFGNGNPFSNRTIYRLKSVQKYKNPVYREIGSLAKHKENKKTYIRKLSKLPTKALKNIDQAFEDSNHPFHEVMVSMLRSY